MRGRGLVVAALSATWLFAGALPALADPAGPTDYETEVASIEPSIEGLDVDVIGGDAFIRLTSTSSATVEVKGYSGEPYLRFLPDGTVEENELSPTRYLNVDRYAIVSVPEQASASASPVWRLARSDGSYAWHDHRAHWMNTQPPPGAGPGDQILEGVIPLIVDGAEVDVTVISVWQPQPSFWPVMVGLVVGVGVGLAATQRPAWATVATLVLSLSALTVALVAFFSVPLETGPSWVLWLVPLTAGLLALLALRPSLWGRWSGSIQRSAPTLVLIGSLELVVWGLVRWDWMTAAILPTVLPFWVDRMVVAAVLAGAALITVHQFRVGLGGQPSTT